MLSTTLWCLRFDLAGRFLRFGFTKNAHHLYFSIKTLEKHENYGRIISMNKDVIYIEPEDDITDIISRLKTSKQKIVALVPPKKVGIMRSSVNIKLIAKTAKEKDKAAVIVTTDQSLIKLAATSGLPTAKTLNSRPVLPSEYIREQQEEKAKKKEAEEVEAEEAEIEEAEKPKKNEGKEEVSLDSEELEDDVKKQKSSDKKVSKIPNFDKYRKPIIFGGIGLVIFVIVMVWAFVFAPFADITVKMKTVSTNISENVTFVTDAKNVVVKEGKFLLEQIKYEEESSVEFEATGKANKGDKAEGTLGVIAYLDESASSVTVPKGTIFTNGDKEYISDSDVTIKMGSTCENPKPIQDGFCQTSAAVGVTAKESGTSYNIDKKDGWKVAIKGVSAYASTAMTGGTDKQVTVVSESDIEDAKNQLSNNTDAKQALFQQINENEMVKIESSFKVEAKDPVSKPAKGEEVKDGETPKLTAKTIYTVYVVDRVAIDEYVKHLAADKVGENDKIYSTGNPFFERFLEEKNSFTAKFKTTVKIGPEISEASIMETAKGKKVGEVKVMIKDISRSINDVIIDTSFPWVRSVPTDPNKVNIKIEVEE